MRDDKRLSNQKIYSGLEFGLVFELENKGKSNLLN